MNVCLNGQQIVKLKNNGVDGYWIDLEYGKYILKLENEKQALYDENALLKLKVDFLQNKISVLESMNIEFEKELTKYRKSYIANRILASTTAISISIMLSAIAGVIVYSITENSLK